MLVRVRDTSAGSSVLHHAYVGAVIFVLRDDDAFA